MLNIFHFTISVCAEMLDLYISVIKRKVVSKLNAPETKKIAVLISFRITGKKKLKNVKFTKK